MIQGRFKFIFEDEKAQLTSEFEVKENATVDEVLEAFAVFLELCGLSYEDNSTN